MKKALKKLTVYFLSNPVQFKGQNYQKQKVLGTSDQLLCRLQNKFRKIHLLVMYSLSKFDDVINKVFFELFQKLCLQIYANQFMATCIIHFLFNLESVKRKGRNYNNLNISRMKRAFPMK